MLLRPLTNKEISDSPVYAVSNLSYSRASSTPLHVEDREADSTQQPFFGAMGCTSAIVFTCFGAAYGTAKSGVGISAMGVLRPDLIVKSTLDYMLHPTLPAK